MFFEEIALFALYIWLEFDIILPALLYVKIWNLKFKIFGLGYLDHLRNIIYAFWRFTFEGNIQPNKSFCLDIYTSFSSWAECFDYCFFSSSFLCRLSLLPGHKRLFLSGNKGYFQSKTQNLMIDLIRKRYASKHFDFI